MWPTFHRLLSVLGVPLHKYPVTATLHTTHNRRVYPMPFIRDGKVCWSIFRPDRLSKMLQFQRALQCAEPLIATADTSITVEQFVEGLKLSRSFKDDFFYPLLLAAWRLEMDEFKVLLLSHNTLAAPGSRLNFIPRSCYLIRLLQ
ncbi:MAG: hypothetical protein MOB07_12890 [Acidobacteria bacterium]|nr:hypothetical protein [Acidobacteriota bacterium]